MKKLISLLAAFALVSASVVAEAEPRHKHGVKAAKMHKAKAGKAKKAHKKSLHAKKAKRAPAGAYAGPRVAAQ